MRYIFIMLLNYTVPLLMFYEMFPQARMMNRSHNWMMFLDFAQTYDRQYDVSEVEYRFGVFSGNIEKMLAEDDLEVGFNQFTDLEHDEFKSEKRGCTVRRRSIFSNCDKFDETMIDLDTVPDSIDWRELGAVTNVKNQGQCGSCWAFSATGAIEGAVQIATGQLYNFSEQQLVDCVEPTDGCNGGLMDDAFVYFEKNTLCEYDDIPYDAVSERCPTEACSDVGVKLSGCVDVPSGNETALKLAVSRGPVSVAIEADKMVFQLYTGGIIKGSMCGTNLDHGVLVVGYGEEDGTPYWIVKNSWGGQWGESGYVRIERSESTELGEGVCGIAMQASYPVV